MNFNCYFSNSKPNLANGFQFMTNLITKCKRQMVKASTYTISRVIVSHELTNKQVPIHRTQKPPAGNSCWGHKTDNIGRVMRRAGFHCIQIWCWHIIKCLTASLFFLLSKPFSRCGLHPTVYRKLRTQWEILFVHSEFGLNQKTYMYILFNYNNCNYTILARKYVLLGHIAHGRYINKVKTGGPTVFLRLWKVWSLYQPSEYRLTIYRYAIIVSFSKYR